MKMIRLLTCVAMGAMVFGVCGCASKKYVRNTVTPVQQHVEELQKQADAAKIAIGDLDRQIATTDEKTGEANRKAEEAAKAAAQAGEAAHNAASRADQANGAARQALTEVSELRTNLDNYTLLKAERIYFGVSRSTLSAQAKQQLDEAVGEIENAHNYVIEVAAYTDRTGSKAYNLALARSRADAVVHYLTVDKGIPLRNIREIGVGEEFPNAVNQTRAERQENRRAEVKIYSLNLHLRPTEAQLR